MMCTSPYDLLEAWTLVDFELSSLLSRFVSVTLYSLHNLSQLLHLQVTVSYSFSDSLIVLRYKYTAWYRNLKKGKLA